MHYCCVYKTLSHRTNWFWFSPQLLAEFLCHCVDIPRTNFLGIPRAGFSPTCNFPKLCSVDTNVTQDANWGLPRRLYGGQVSSENTAFGDHTSGRVSMYINLLRALKSPSIKELAQFNLFKQSQFFWPWLLFLMVWSVPYTWLRKCCPALYLYQLYWFLIYS